MSIKSFTLADGSTDRYDYNYLDNKPTIHDIPSGGTTGQVLKKTSGTDYAVEWGDDSGPVTDVQVNGTSVLSNGVANIPYSTTNDPGLVRIGSDYGIGLLSAGSSRIVISKASDAQIKEGTQQYKPIVSQNQHLSTFYGLAKAAGDTTQSSSSNAVGTYTSQAKSAIQTMLGVDIPTIAAQVEIPLVQTVSGTTPSITGQPNVRYVCGQVTTLSITPPASGTIDVIFESGTNAAVLTIPNTVKFPSWFDVTALQTNTIYEMVITDGVYGSVMTWES